MTTKIDRFTAMGLTRDQLRELSRELSPTMTDDEFNAAWLDFCQVKAAHIAGLNAQGQAKRCGICGEEIATDSLTGTTCACARGSNPTLKTATITNVSQHARMAMAAHLQRLANALRAGAAIKSGGLYAFAELGVTGSLELETPPDLSIPDALKAREFMAPDPLGHKAIEDLLDGLRNTPNWLKESFGDWKDSTTSYSRAPFQAADVIEKLVAAATVASDWRLFIESCSVADGTTVDGTELSARAIELLQKGSDARAPLADDHTQDLQQIAAMLGIQWWGMEEIAQAIADLQMQGPTPDNIMRTLWLVTRIGGGDDGVRIPLRALGETDWTRAVMNQDTDPVTGDTILAARLKVFPGDAS